MMDLNIQFRNHLWLLVCLFTTTPQFASGDFQRDNAIDILEYLNELDSAQHPTDLLEAERGVFDDLKDESRKERELYDHDDLFSDDSAVTDNKAVVGNWKGKRAWEEIDWKPPKRAWGITKRAWEMLGSLKGAGRWKDKGKRNDERLIDVPLQSSDSGPWMIDDIGYDADDYVENGIQSGEPSEKRSWEAVQGRFRCSCCSEKAASVCCSVCKALTTYKRNYNNGDNGTLRGLTCRCCKSVWYQTDECCFMCKLLLGSKLEH